MKYRNYLFLPFLLLINIPAALPDEVFYKSNEIGQIFDEVDENFVFNYTQAPDDDPQYFIGIETGGGIEKRRLYSAEDAEFVKTWEFYYYYEGAVHHELEYSGDELVLKRTYLKNGNIEEEYVYENSVVKEHSLFEFNNRRELVALKVLDKDGELIYKESYAYTDLGMLRELIHTDSEDNVNIYSYNFGNGILIEEISRENEFLYISRFSEDGKLLLNEIWKNSDIRSRSEREYNSATRKLERVVKEDFALNTRTVQTYDDQGMLVNEVSGDDGAKQYFHDGQGRVIRIRKNSLTGIEEWKYEYDGDDEDVSRETYSFQGRIIKVIVYLDEDHRYEDIYRQVTEFGIGRRFSQINADN